MATRKVLLSLQHHCHQFTLGQERHLRSVGLCHCQNKINTHINHRHRHLPRLPRLYLHLLLSVSNKKIIFFKFFKNSSIKINDFTDEPRSRRPADVADIDYYDEELLEEMRPRRPFRRRPNFRERDRDFYDVRDPDRPYR